jgi:hypothetical protein
MGARKLDIGEFLRIGNVNNENIVYKGTSADTKKSIGDYSVNIKQKIGEHEFSEVYSRQDLIKSMKNLESKGLKSSCAYDILVKLDKRGTEKMKESYLEQSISDRNSANKKSE